MLGSRKFASTQSDVVAVLPQAQCLAKTQKTGNSAVIPGRTVLSHCLIVGKVAQALIGRMPEWLRDALFPKGSELILTGLVIIFTWVGLNMRKASCYAWR